MTMLPHPDPQHPEGGFAFLELPQGAVGDSAVMVSVMDAYSGRWLAPSEAPGAPVAIGDPNWQPEPHAFGPYPVYDHDGADWVRIGPEIVNKLEEYTPLRIQLGGAIHDVTWPDDIPPRAGAAMLGGLSPVERKVPEAPAVMQASPPPEPEPEPVRAPPEPEPVITPDPPAEQGTRKGLWVMLALLLLAVVAGAVWWFYPFEAETQTTDKANVPVERETTQPVPQADACSSDALNGLAAFAALQDQLAGCGAKVSADAALGLIEKFASDEDPGALAMLGALYDETVTEDGVETAIGLTFTADPARAAEYYARAVQAGSDSAEARLTSVCAQLSVSASTLDKGAFDDYCP